MGARRQLNGLRLRLPETSTRQVIALRDNKRSIALLRMEVLGFSARE